MPKHMFIKVDASTAPLGYEELRNHNHVSVDDNIILPLLPQLRMVRTFHHTYDTPDMGLAYYGITIIPAESLPSILDILHCDKRRAQKNEANALLALIWEAIEKKAVIMHFGI